MCVCACVRVCVRVWYLAALSSTIAFKLALTHWPTGSLTHSLTDRLTLATNTFSLIKRRSDTVGHAANYLRKPEYLSATTRALVRILCCLERVPSGEHEDWERGDAMGEEEKKTRFCCVNH